MQKNNKKSSADGLKLRLVGQTKTDIVDTGEEESYHEIHEFLSFGVQLASFGGKAASGVHSLPFLHSTSCGPATVFTGGVA